MSAAEDRVVYTFTSDGTYMPEGEYFVEVWPSGEASLAWRPEPRPQIVWGPPIEGRQR